MTTEKTDEDKLGNDLSSILTEFLTFRDQHDIEHKLLQELRGVVQEQKKSLQFLRDAERIERQNSEQAWIIVAQQNQIVVGHIRTKEENAKLLDENAALKKENEDIIEKVQKEKETSVLEYKKLELVKSKEISELQFNCEQRVAMSRQTMEEYRSEFEMKRQIMVETFDQMRSEKQEQTNLMTMLHEEQMQKLSEQMSMINSEHEIKLEECESTIAALKDHIFDLERKLKSTSEKYHQHQAMTPAAATAEKISTFRYQLPSNQRSTPSYAKKTPTCAVPTQRTTTTMTTTTTTAATPVEFASVGWKNQKVGVSVSGASSGVALARKRNIIQSLPFLGDSTHCENAGAKRVSFAARSAASEPPKKRKLFTPQDDIILGDSTAM